MSKTSLRVMSMNVENLFSPGIQFYKSMYSQQEYDEKVDWIGSMISQCQAHVVGLVEIGEKAQKCANDIMQAANNKDKTGSKHKFEFKYLASPCKGSTKIRTGVISRFKLTGGESLSTYPKGFRADLYKPGTNEDKKKNWIEVPSKGFSRPVAKVTVNPPKGANSFNIFVVHLKSKRPNKAAHDGFNEAIGIVRSAIQRNIEAGALRYYFDTFLPNQYKKNKKVATIAAGDFNDTPTSVPFENIRGTFDTVPGPASKWSAADKKRLVSCSRLHLKISAHEDKLYSYVHNESFTLIDQMLVTEHLVKKFARMEIYNDHVFRHEEMSSPTDQEKQWKSAVSDHGVVLVEFKGMLK